MPNFQVSIPGSEITSLSTGTHHYHFKVTDILGRNVTTTDHAFTVTAPVGAAVTLNSLTLSQNAAQYSYPVLNITTNINIVSATLKIDGAVTNIPGNGNRQWCTNPYTGAIVAPGVSAQNISLTHFLIDNAIYAGSHSFELDITDANANVYTITATLTVPTATMDSSRPGLTPTATLNTLYTVTPQWISTSPYYGEGTYLAPFNLPSTTTYSETFVTGGTPVTIPVTTGQYLAVIISPSFYYYNQYHYQNNINQVPFSGYYGANASLWELLVDTFPGQIGINDPTFINGGYGGEIQSGLTIIDVNNSSSQMLNIIGTTRLSPDPTLTLGFFDSYTSLESVAPAYSNYCYAYSSQLNSYGLQFRYHNLSLLSSVVVKNSANQTLVSVSNPSTLPLTIRANNLLTLGSDSISDGFCWALPVKDIVFSTDYSQPITITNTYTNSSTSTYESVDMMTYDWYFYDPEILNFFFDQGQGINTYINYRFNITSNLTTALANIAAYSNSISQPTGYILPAYTGYDGVISYMYPNVDFEYTSGIPSFIGSSKESFVVYSDSGTLIHGVNFIFNEQDSNLYYSLPLWLANSTVSDTVYLTRNTTNYYQYGYTDLCAFSQMQDRIKVDFGTDYLIHSFHAKTSNTYSSAWDLTFLIEPGCTVVITDGTSTATFNYDGTYNTSDIRLSGYGGNYSPLGYPGGLVLNAPGIPLGYFFTPIVPTTYTCTATRHSDGKIETQTFKVFPRDTNFYKFGLDISYTLTSTYNSSTNTTSYAIVATGADAGLIDWTQSDVYVYDTALTYNSRASVHLASGNAGTQNWNSPISIETNRSLTISATGAYFPGHHITWIDLSRTRIRKADGTFLHIPYIPSSNSGWIGGIKTSIYTI
jgi:hypothetical protein